MVVRRSHKTTLRAVDGFEYDSEEDREIIGAAFSAELGHL